MDGYNAVKKVWAEPRLIVHGDVERITQQPIYKQFGPSDGMVFEGDPPNDDGPIGFS